MRASAAQLGSSDRSRLPVVVLVVVLLSLATQLSVAAHRTLTTGRPAAFPAPYAVGDTVRVLEARGSDGEPVRVSLTDAEGAASVIYAFHSECVHSRDVAPVWAEHFASLVASSRTRRVAVTQEDPTTAVQYAASFGWNVEVLSLAHVPPNDRARLLVSRTPWVFVFDSAGVLRHHGHGSGLAQVERILASIDG